MGLERLVLVLRAVLARTSGRCMDTNYGALSSDGRDCSTGETSMLVWPSLCGDYLDDDDFTMLEMCCACGGGKCSGLVGDEIASSYCETDGPENFAVTTSGSWCDGGWCDNDWNDLQCDDGTCCSCDNGGCVDCSRRKLLFGYFAPVDCC